MTTQDIDNFNYENLRQDNARVEDSNEYVNNHGDDKIVGGVNVEISLYPYHAAYGSNCGGAVIARDWVITAGHCG